VTAIDDGNVGLNVMVQDPRQKLSAPVSLVCRQILRPNSEPARVLDHSLRGQYFLAETCRRCWLKRRFGKTTMRGKRPWRFRWRGRESRGA